MDEPLTPIYLLVGYRLLSVPDGLITDNEFDVSPEHLIKRMYYLLNKVLNNFWKRWEKEYLLELRDAHCYGEKTSENCLLNVGDVMLYSS